jgi:hypothetical protein
MIMFFSSIVGITWYASIACCKPCIPQKFSMAYSVKRTPSYLGVIKGLRHFTECVNAVVNIVFHKPNCNYDSYCFGITNILNMIMVLNTQAN